MKKLLKLLMCLGLIFALSVPAGAAEGLPAVIDNAGLLTAQEEASLEELAKALTQQYGMDIVILTVDSTGSQSPETFADDYYDGQGYGDDGILFLLSMGQRDWYISTCGDARYALTDYGIQASAAEALPYLSSGDYYSGFYAWLDILPYYFDLWLAEDPADGYADASGSYYHGSQETIVSYSSGSQPSFLISLLIGLAAAAVTVLIMRSGMNTKGRQSSAGSYLAPGSYHLRTHRDIFLYSNVSKTARPKDTGSSVHRSSSGRSHGGGGGKF